MIPEAVQKYFPAHIDPSQLWVNYTLAVALLLATGAAGGPVRLIVDGSKVGHGHQRLLVALGYRRRAIPLAWTRVRHTRGHSPGYKQGTLLVYTQRLVPPGAEVVVIGDSEFGPLQALLASWGGSMSCAKKATTCCA